MQEGREGVESRGCCEEIDNHGKVPGKRIPLQATVKTTETYMLAIVGVKLAEQDYRGRSTQYFIPCPYT